MEDVNEKCRRLYLSLQPEVKRIFQQNDSDKNGTIEREEFRVLVACALKALKSSTSVQSETARLFKEIDKNHDKRLDWDEFWNYFSSDNCIPNAETWIETLAILKSWGCDISSVSSYKIPITTTTTQLR